MAKSPIDVDVEQDVYLPNQDQGLFLLPGMDKYPAPVRTARAKTDFLVASSIPAQAIALQRAMNEKRKLDLADFDILFPSVPVYVRNFSYRMRMPRIGEKLLLTGASGRRVRRRLYSESNGLTSDARVVEQLAQAVGDPDFGIPVASEDRNYLLNLPYVVETKNLTNFYHFTSETLIYLSLYQEFGLGGEIILYTSNPQPAASFVLKSIQSFYPDLLDRIVIHRGSMEIDECLLPFNLLHYFSFKRDLQFEVKDARHASAPLIEVDYNNMKTISLNSRDQALDKHRSLVLSKPVTVPPRPYVYVRRKSGNSRPIVGEEKLQRILDDLGFVNISFEDYSPLEQAQIVNGADILISAHGAGFANMLYAKPDAVFVELGNLQLARHRFGEFNMMASSSGALYTHFFTDHDFDDDTRTPNVHADGLRGVRLPEVALNRIDGFLKTLVLREEFTKFRKRIDRLAADLDFAGIIAAISADSRFLYSLAEIPVAAALSHQYFGDFEREAHYYQIALDVAPLRTSLRERRVEALVRAGRQEAAKEALETFRIMAPRWFERYLEGAGGIEAVLAGGTHSLYESD